MNAANMPSIGQILEQFEDRGYIILKQMFPARVLRDVRNMLDRWVEGQAEMLLADGLIDDPKRGEPFETRYARLYENCKDRAPLNIREDLHCREMYGLFCDERLLSIVEQILGPELRLYPNYFVRPKLPDHAGTQVLWHQDAGYTQAHDPNTPNGQLMQLRMINCWAPIVPARPENGCMQFVPGTHKLGVVPHETGDIYLEIAEAHLKPHLTDAVDVICDPGDVVLFSNLMFHCGRPNVTDTVRWSSDFRYQDATQPTLRPTHGHVVHSRQHPDRAVAGAEHWAGLSFQ